MGIVHRDTAKLGAPAPTTIAIRRATLHRCHTTISQGSSCLVRNAPTSVFLGQTLRVSELGKARSDVDVASA